MQAGDTISSARAGSRPRRRETLRRGRVVLVYPEIEQGRVIADVEVEGLGDYFVGERTRVYVATGTREALVVPDGYVYRRFGVSYVKLKDGTEVVVQVGMPVEGGIEILAGLHDGDVVVDAMKLGLSGFLTRSFISSPLTPLLLLAALVVGTLALFALPREEEPQISVPMVDILVTANGYKAGDAVELITKPLEDIIKGINGVEHVYSSTQDDPVVVTARFFVGTDEDTALTARPREDPRQHRRPAQGHSRADHHRPRHQRRGDRRR